MPKVRAPAFEEWVARRGRQRSWTAYLLTGDWQRAEDLLQTARQRPLG
ncbi:MAG TPA: hypothetical protein VFQ85_03280 [Mycobacteriales bacterium]|nr:hypothetical protein [Mycobacteriales bacterium]